MYTEAITLPHLPATCSAFFQNRVGYGVLTGPLFRKPDAGPPQARQPFDCCALSFQPFEHPVCARNSDGTGVVFDLVNIIPWLKCVFGVRAWGETFMLFDNIGNTIIRTP